jgi:hypothetical protein
MKLMTPTLIKQDGTTGHTVNKSMKLLDGVFGEILLSRGILTSRSPNLTPSDTFL